METKQKSETDSAIRIGAHCWELMQNGPFGRGMDLGRHGTAKSSRSNSWSMGFVMMKLDAVGTRVKPAGVRQGSRWNGREGDQHSGETESWMRLRRGVDMGWKSSKNFLASGWLLEWLELTIGQSDGETDEIYDPWLLEWVIEHNEAHVRWLELKDPRSWSEDSLAIRFHLMARQEIPSNNLDYL